jgi:hypothetical protein
MRIREIKYLGKRRKRKVHEKYNKMEECDAGIRTIRSMLEENKRFDINVESKKWIIWWKKMRTRGMKCEGGSL